MRSLARWILLIAMAVAAVADCGSVALASITGDTISIAFARDEPPNTPGCALNPTDVAGAPGYETANWNNEYKNVGSDSGLIRDTNGTTTTTDVSVTWASDNTYSTDGVRQFSNAFTGTAEVLLTGYLDGGNNAVQGFDEIQVTNLPADIAAGYSVVIYALGGGLNRNATYQVNDQDPIYVKPGGPGGIASYYGPTAIVRSWVQAIGDDPNYGPDSYGNYMVFTGLSGDLDIQAHPNGGGTPRCAINAIQIIKNP